MQTFLSLLYYVLRCPADCRCRAETLHLSIDDVSGSQSWWIWHFATCFQLHGAVESSSCHSTMSINLGHLIYYCLYDVSNTKKNFTFDVLVTCWMILCTVLRTTLIFCSCAFTALHHPQQHSAAPGPTGEDVWVHGGQTGLCLPKYMCPLCPWQFTFSKDFLFLACNIWIITTQFRVDPRPSDGRSNHKLENSIPRASKASVSC